jgi:N-acetylglucosaminyl-diphospho-decaprenol L-rhamnosyltransferase
MSRVVRPTVSILIVTYQSGEHIRGCLRSIERGSDGTSMETIVVDNASTDDTVDIVRSEFPWASVFRASENVGFARAVNAAAAQARGQFLLLLNPDTEMQVQTVDKLVAFSLQHPEYGVYGGRTLSSGGATDPSSCWGQPSLWSQFCFATLLNTLFPRSRIFDPESLGRWDRDSVREVGIVTGCLLLISRDLWDRLEGFDPRFFMYGEDVDLSFRALSMGFRPAITPDATIVHEVGASSISRPDKLVLVLTGKATFFRKNWTPRKQVLALAFMTVGVGCRALLARFRADPGPRAWQVAWKERQRWLKGYAEDRTPGTAGSVALARFERRSAEDVPAGADAEGPLGDDQ